MRQPQVVPGRPHTAASLVSQLDHLRQQRGMTAYGIAKVTGLGVSINAVTRLFTGYASLGREADRVNDPSEVGRVHLSTFLQVIHALGYDVEIVSREAPGRSEL